MNFFSLAYDWFEKQHWQVFDFQQKAWDSYASGKSGLIIAPTGSGKTYSLFIPLLLDIHQKIANSAKQQTYAIWITPMRSLANEIKQAGERFCRENNLPIQIAIRNGDTSTKDRAAQKKKPPHVFIITPESLHVMMASAGAGDFFSNVSAIVVDEWHELMGSKRGVQTELAISWLKALQPNIKIWGISATIGNLDEAPRVLLGNNTEAEIVKSDLKKQIEVISLLPEKMETMPWAGHLGIKMVEALLPVIEKSKTTLIFTNTRAQSEIWYQRLLEVHPDLAGLMAIHHGSIDKKVRLWVEEALRQEQLKVVVCTSSLDLGVDFAPVESVIQIGGPKGVARFIQRAGRSGHQPGKTSRIYFLPTHGLELIEASALQKAVSENIIEDKPPLTDCFDTLIQYLITLACGDGFYPNEIFEQVKSTHCFASITHEEWQWILNFVVYGSQSLEKYEEFKKVVPDEKGLFKVTSKSIAMRHRMHIGTIVSDATLTIKFVKGPKIGFVEEWFIGSLNPGDIFWFSGKCLQFEKMHNNEVLVRNAKSKKGKVPSWMGGRMPLSSQLSDLLRMELTANYESPEKTALQPILNKQKEVSHIPEKNEFLIESFETREGHHLVFYPFEGRLVHEALASLVSYRISEQMPVSFSIAYNDYGFELLSNEKIPDELHHPFLFHSDNLLTELQNAMNAAELARRKFRDIAVISGLIFNGYPGKQKKDKHLQASSKLFFNVFQDFEPDNLLLKQAINETFFAQIEEVRLRKTLERIVAQKWVVKETGGPTPFAFPIMIDRLREKLSSENLEDRIKKMTLQYG